MMLQKSNLLSSFVYKIVHMRDTLKKIKFSE